MPSQIRTPDRPDAILARHFSTALNEHGISRAWLSTGIDKGAAEKLVPGVAAALKKYGVDSLVSSDLPRAEQSMKLIAREMGGDVETESTPRLRTWNTGDAGGKKESETLPLRQKYIRNPEIPMPGGESFGDDFIDGRYRPELQDILKRRKAGEELAFIAHGHQMLAAPHILRDDDEVDASKLPSLDEDYPPGSVWGFYIEGNKIRMERLDKQEANEAKNVPQS
jgi:broad specificity phosphatase PhoE